MQRPPKSGKWLFASDISVNPADCNAFSSPGSAWKTISPLCTSRALQIAPSRLPKSTSPECKVSAMLRNGHDGSLVALILAATERESITSPTASSVTSFCGLFGETGASNEQTRKMKTKKTKYTGLSHARMNDDCNGSHVPHLRRRVIQS